MCGVVRMKMEMKGSCNASKLEMPLYGDYCCERDEWRDGVEINGATLLRMVPGSINKLVALEDE